MKLFDYIRETQAELKHVSWPTRKQALAFTFLVIGLSIAVALYLGLFDFIFTYLLELTVA
jgi:preprotein translocase subunit SecE